jgi:hypothetical protein
MKRKHRYAAGSILLALMLTGASAQVVESTTTTTTTNGTVTEFTPQTIVVRSETSPEPIQYRFSKTTTYVDETGAPVSREIIKTGLPVTIHYVKEGDRMLANKVIVKKTVARSTRPLEEKTTTTTTTTTGTLSEFGPQDLVVRTESSTEPIHYGFSKTTTWVDDTGATISRERIKTGIPVTIHYVREGDRMVASKVVVKKTLLSPGPTAIEREEKTTTTTTTTPKKE